MPHHSEIRSAVDLQHILPRGWAYTKLGHIAEIILGQSPPSSTYNQTGQGLPFYQGKLEFGELYPSPRKWCSVPSKIAEKGDVLISVRAPVGPTNICPERSCIGRGLAAIRGLCNISPLFVLYLIRAFETSIAEKGTGTTFNAITGVQLREFEIPLPPLAEHQRIVAKIEALFSQLDASVESQKKVKVQLNRYRKSVMKNAFEGKLTEGWRADQKGKIKPVSKLLADVLEQRREEGKGSKKPEKAAPLDSSVLYPLPAGWEWMKVTWLCSIQTGPFGTQVHKSDYTDSGTPMVEFVGTFQENDSKTLSSKFVSEKKAQELKRFELKTDDILFSRVGTVGRCAIVPPSCDGWIMSTNSIRVRIVSEYLSPKYLLHYFTSPISQHFTRLKTKGTTLAETNSNVVGELPIVVPPLIEQQEITKEIELRISIADVVEEVIDENLRASARLKQSILKTAFEGKLVRQDPNDEPADKLLEQIRAERLNQERNNKQHIKTTGLRRTKKKAIEEVGFTQMRFKHYGE